VSRTVWAVKAATYCARLLADGDMGDELRSLLIDLRTPTTSGPVGSIVVSPNASGSYVIRSDQRVWNDDVPAADVPDQVVHMLLRAALDQEPSLVHIHAGSVAAGDRTAVLAGLPGCGKSTAIAALVSSGLSYVTDERLAVSADGRSVGGFPKPLSLIEGSFGVLARLDPELTGHGASNGETWQIPASSIGPVASQAFRSPIVLIFIAYRSGRALRVTSVSPVAAAARLLSDSPDVSVRGHHGADAIVTLTSSVASVEIEYSELDDLVEAVRNLLDHPPTVRHDEPMMLDSSAPCGHLAPRAPSAVDTTGTYAIVEGASVWVVDGCALAYIHEAGSIIELDSINGLWLQLLDGNSTVDVLIEEVAEATGTSVAAVSATACSIVHGLWVAGVIGPTSVV
jgi:hypothetical protein